jgi:tripartite-type tricarboxylate transporter receptor subunit TctC
MRLKSNIGVLVCAFVLAGIAAAQGYPAKPVRIIVPFATGGGSDITARVLAAKLAESLGQSVVVENRPSASGIVGNEFVAKAPPDGYNLLLVDPTFSILPGINNRLPYDAEKDFVPVTLIITAPSVLVVHPVLPAQSVKELIALARSKPGEIAFASGGIGTPPHMNAELFKAMAKVNILHVPYKGVSAAIADLIGGQIHMAIPAVTAVLPYVNSGRLRALAVTAVSRSPQLPQVPTLREAGLPAYLATLWFGLAAPAGTPREIVARLHAESVKALAAPEIRQRFTSQGAEVVGSSPERFAQFLGDELRKWAAVTKAAGFKSEF